MPWSRQLEQRNRRPTGPEEPRAAAQGAARRLAQRLAPRGIRAGARGRQADDQAAALRRPARRRRGDPSPLDRRDGDGRGQDPRRDPAGVSQRLAGQGSARRHGQRLPRPPRRRVDDADLWLARDDRRLHPDRPDRRCPPGRVCLRHHLRHQQGVRLRLPPRRAEAAPARATTRPQVVRAGVPRPWRPRRGRRCPSSAPTTTRSSTRPTAS